MLKFEKGTLKGFAAGTLLTVLTLGTILPSSAATMKEIKVAMGGIKIYVDGNLKKPTDVNGNVVEPMIYDGTTYLPVRALTGMLTDKEVAWDQQSQTVYIGQRPDAGVQSVPIDEVEPYKIWNYYVSTGKDAQFTVLGETYSPFNKITFPNGTLNYRENDLTYKLDSGYDSICGKFIIPFNDLGNEGQSTLQFYNVDQYGEETLIKEYSAKAGDAAIDVDVNLQGCNFLRIKAKNNGKGNGCILYDVTLTTAK